MGNFQENLVRLLRKNVFWLGFSSWLVCFAGGSFFVPSVCGVGLRSSLFLRVSPKRALALPVGQLLECYYSAAPLGGFCGLLLPGFCLRFLLWGCFVLSWAAFALRYCFSPYIPLQCRRKGSEPRPRPRPWGKHISKWPTGTVARRSRKSRSAKLRGIGGTTACTRVSLSVTNCHAIKKPQ